MEGLGIPRSKSLKHASEAPRQDSRCFMTRRVRQEPTHVDRNFVCCEVGNRQARLGARQSPWFCLSLREEHVSRLQVLGASESEAEHRQALLACAICRRRTSRTRCRCSSCCGEANGLPAPVKASDRPIPLVFLNYVRGSVQLFRSDAAVVDLL